MRGNGLGLVDVTGLGGFVTATQQYDDNVPSGNVIDAAAGVIGNTQLGGSFPDGFTPPGFPMLRRLSRAVILARALVSRSPRSWPTPPRWSCLMMIYRCAWVGEGRFD